MSAHGYGMTARPAEHGLEVAGGSMRPGRHLGRVTVTALHGAPPGGFTAPVA
ncbi:hypothetical protein [Streptomyces niger]|uniref:hypothetical protein n=1 Tax=Streptomyces niger TaxID=66373 RepID=UPI0018FE164D|nr:hypothetical protein [Streptomyces niger]